MKQEEPGIELVKRILKTKRITDDDYKALMEFHPDTVAKRKKAAEKAKKDDFLDDETMERLKLEYLGQGENP